MLHPIHTERFNPVLWAAGKHSAKRRFGPHFHLESVDQVLSGPVIRTRQHGRIRVQVDHYGAQDVFLADCICKKWNFRHLVGTFSNFLRGLFNALTD